MMSSWNLHLFTTGFFVCAGRVMVHIYLSKRDELLKLKTLDNMILRVLLGETAEWYVCATIIRNREKFDTQIWVTS
jgi:hypothetical protein